MECDARRFELRSAPDKKIISRRMRKTFKILIDFDGTLCRVETIPYVAEVLGVENYLDIRSYTLEACRYGRSYEENLRRRIAMMSDVSVGDFVGAVTKSLFRSGLVDFVLKHQDICEIVSCNLDCWCKPLTEFLGVRCSYSKAIVESGRVSEVKKIIDKAAIVEEYKGLGYYVVFVGDSANDFDAMQVADRAILIGNINIDSIHGTENLVRVDSDKKLIEILYAIVDGI